MEPREKVRDHTSDAYGRLRKVMARYFEDKIDSFTGGSLNILDIGCGKHPIILECIQNKNKDEEIQIDFLDKRPFEELSVHRNGISRGDVFNISLDVEVDDHNPGDRFEKNETEFNWRFFGKNFHEVNINRNKFFKKKYDFIVAHAVIHELLVDASETEMGFLSSFFQEMLGALSEGGLLLIGGPYYPRYLSSEEVRELFKYHRETTGHADPPSVFLQPERIIEVARLKLPKEESYHFKLIYDQEHYYPFGDLDIGRKWYLSILEKVRLEKKYDA